MLNVRRLKASEDATAAAEAAAKATQAQTDALIAHIRAVRQTRENLQTLAEGQQVLNDFWRVASGQLETYRGSIDLARISVVNLDAELDALFGGQLADPLQPIIEQFGDLDTAISTLTETGKLTSFAADQAIATAEIKLVNPAISDVAENMRLYIRVMDDVQDKFESTDAISNRLTTSIRQQASGFEELARSIDVITEAEQRRQRQQGRIAAPRLPGQSLDFTGNFDRFDGSLRAARGEVDLLTGVFDTLYDHTEIFADIGVTAFDELSRSVLQSAEDIDTVGESLAAVSDLAARVALGDISALVQLPFRISEVNAAQDAAALQKPIVA